MASNCENFYRKSHIHIMAKTLFMLITTFSPYLCPSTTALTRTRLSFYRTEQIDTPNEVEKKKNI